MKIKSNRLLSGIFMAVVFLSLNACRNEQESRLDFFNFPQEGMTTLFQYVFHPLDSTSNDDSYYDLALVVRYNDFCKLRSLPLEIETGSLYSDTYVHFRANIPLYDNNNHSDGKGNFGIFEVTVPIISNQKWEEGFFVAVSTKEKDTSGIISLGVTADKIN